MTVSAQPGPELNWGQNPPPAPGAASPDYNPDLGQGGDFAGRGLIDPRYGFKNGGNGGPGSPSLLGILMPAGMNYAVLDQVPSIAAANNIAAAANVVSGTPMTLVSASGAGITVMTAALFIPQTGLTVPKGSLAIDGLPGIVAFGQNGSIGAADPTKALARAVSITGVAGGAGGTFKVAGYDLYGNPQTEDVVAGSGAGTTNGKKGFKFIGSVTPQFTDAHNYSVGTADVYELPLRADNAGYLQATFNNAPVTSLTFVAADTTSPTSTTGSVRGTIVVTSDGTKRLQVMQGVSPANCLTATGLFGVTPA